MTDKEKDLFILQNKLQGYQEAAKRVEAEIKRHEVKKAFQLPRIRQRTPSSSCKAS